MQIVNFWDYFFPRGPFFSDLWRIEVNLLPSNSFLLVCTCGFLNFQIERVNKSVDIMENGREINYYRELPLYIHIIHSGKGFETP